MLPRARIIVWIAVVLAAGLFSQFVAAHGMSAAEKQSIIDGGNLGYLSLGATHMLSGYDHLLFVFGIVFFLTRFFDVVKYVTAFTLGHSVTLILATINGFAVNYFLIDAVIGLSVSYIAFSNLNRFQRVLGVNSPNLMVMIVGLGLIHGLGLSTRLQELPLNQDELLLNIISFNVGIELGQIGALTVMLLLIAIWRKTDAFNPFSLIANYFLIAAGGLLFLMQMHGYLHQQYPDEFGFSEDLHAHAHQHAAPPEPRYTTIDGVSVPNSELKIGKEEAVERALQVILELVGGSVIPLAWRGADVLAVRYIDYGDDSEWVITFVNQADKRNSKSKLLIYLDFDGEYITSSIQE